jgi:uncharacterized protein with HEPN domain
LPFKDPATHLRDILEAIHHIETFVANMNLEVYKADSKTKSAVERQMQIISEAAIRLGEDAERLAPGPDWKGLRGMGNLLRHAYHRTDDELIWNAVQDELPLLKEEILKVIPG